MCGVAAYCSSCPVPGVRCHSTHLRMHGRLGMHPCFMQRNWKVASCIVLGVIWDIISCLSPCRRSDLRAASRRWSVKSTGGLQGPWYDSVTGAGGAPVSGTRARAHTMQRCINHACGSSAPFIRRQRCGSSLAWRKSGTAGRKSQAASLHLGGLSGRPCGVVWAQSGNEVWQSHETFVHNLASTRKLLDRPS